MMEGIPLSGSWLKKNRILPSQSGSSFKHRSQEKSRICMKKRMGSRIPEKEIAAGPYYLVELKPRFVSTMGGPVINTDLQLMNTGDKVIMGDDFPSGANNARALTSGKFSAETVAEILK